MRLLQRHRVRREDLREAVGADVRGLDSFADGWHGGADGNDVESYGVDFVSDPKHGVSDALHDFAVENDASADGTDFGADSRHVCAIHIAVDSADEPAHLAPMP